MDELVKEMLVNLPEEVSDCSKYLALADKAKAAGLEIESCYLEMIAYDEYTHARFLITCLDSLGGKVTDEMREKYLLARERVCERVPSGC